MLSLELTSIGILLDLSGVYSHSDVVDRFFLLYYKFSVDKQLYVELRANEYRCYVELIWHYCGSVLA